MIYLRPIGGLCNRMRAIDGFLTYVEKTKRPLTIIWVNNNKLNCGFHDIFEPLKMEHVQFVELNPRVSFSDKIRVRLLNIAARIISQRVRRILTGLALGDFRIQRVKVNPDWSGIYNSTAFDVHQPMRKTEADFHKNTRAVLKSLLANDPVYISSCYRLFNSSDRYSRFVPTKLLRDQISTITSRFSNTTGLHIRANNHPYASKYSTVEKFEKTISELLDKDPSTTFFLATDSGKVKERLIAKFGVQVIMTNPSDVYSRSEADAIKQAVVDLYCLAKTKRIYGSHYSSFTLTASDIGAAEEVIVK